MMGDRLPKCIPSYAVFKTEGESSISTDKFDELSNSRFKLFPDTINLRVITSLIAIETATFYEHFRYSPESSTLIPSHVMLHVRVPKRLRFAVWG
jgi:hypothetical protein